MTYKTTKEDFEIFKKECLYWIEKLGLKEFEINITHENMMDNSTASCNVDNSAMIVWLNLEPEWDVTERTSDEMVARVAAHECFELLLSPLWIEAEERFATQETLQVARHGIIKRLENCWWEHDYKKSRGNVQIPKAAGKKRK